MTFIVYRFYIEILDVPSKLHSKYLYTSENSAHSFLKLLSMIVKISNITLYSILDGKFGIATQYLHADPSVSKEQRIFIFPKNAADIV